MVEQISFTVIFSFLQMLGMNSIYQNKSGSPSSNSFSVSPTKHRKVSTVKPNSHNNANNLFIQRTKIVIW